MMLHNPSIQPCTGHYPDKDSHAPVAKLRIAHIDLTPSLRGGPRQMISLAKELRYLGEGGNLQQVMIVGRRTSVAAACSVIEGVETREVNHSAISAARAARSANILHIHDDSSIGAGALLSHRGIPYVVTRRTVTPPKVNLMTRWTYGRASRIVGISERVTAVVNAYMNGGDAGTILDCADLNGGANDDQEIRDRQNNFVVGCVGTIDFETKGQDLLVEAARTLLGTCPQVDIVFVGTGPDADRLRNLADGLPNVSLVDWQDDIHSQYRQMDALVQPSRVEALGSTILEAMSMSLPVIATDVGGIPEIVRNEVNGVLIKKNSTGELVTAITRLANDDSLVRRLASSARRSASNLSARRMAEEYYSTYLNVMASEQARRLTF
jgi:glycosyltransferase involved in cell wall biosynthesis